MKNDADNLTLTKQRWSLHADKITLIISA